MHPNDFVTKWHNATLKERSAAQEHFLDLCRLLEEPTPAEADSKGTWYCFEKGAKKAGGGDGWADVWKRGCFGWEYKSKGKDLKEAFKQLQLYTPALEYPPLLIVSDIDSIVIHTAFTGTVPEIHVLTLDDLRDATKRRLLKWAFTEPERLKPGQTTQQLTEAAARRFGELAQALRSRGHNSTVVAHFSQQLLFCLFAESVDLLPSRLFSELLEAGHKHPEQLPQMLESLFMAMANGGMIGFKSIEWFNGGLFDSSAPLPLKTEDISILRELVKLNWAAIEPSIFGTLFERGLDPDKRAQLGAHYTDSGSIMRLVNPVVLDPLQADWEQTKTAIQTVLKSDKSDRSDRSDRSDKSTKSKKAQHLHSDFIQRLVHFRVLDPACGSGNFLLLALTGLKDLEHKALLEAEILGLPRGFPQVGPENVLGIEINPYAAELARVTIWIGEIQWMLAHGFSLSKDPILKPLNIVEQRDALVNADGTESMWPAADVIVGNPPFLGGSKKRRELGDEYFDSLNRVYAERVPGGADLVTYWFEKTRMQIESGQTKRAGLVATNSIRNGKNRQILDKIISGSAGISPASVHSGQDARVSRNAAGNIPGASSMSIFNAWSDEPWINNGAAVRVSLVCFGDTSTVPILNGKPVTTIYMDLTSPVAGDIGGNDVTTARRLLDNAGIAFTGTTKSGPFDIPGDLARQWLKLPNPHGKPNSDVLRPWANGMDLTRRYSDTWIIDFGVKMGEADAGMYEAPFQYVTQHVKKALTDKIVNYQTNNRLSTNIERQYAAWWQLSGPRPEMRRALKNITRYIATSRVAKHRLFVWLPVAVLPDSRLYVIARDDDTTFGVLHSRMHEVWSLATCSWHGDGNEGGRPTYNAVSCFETFPFPVGVLHPTLTLPLTGEGAKNCYPTPPLPLTGEGAKNCYPTPALALTGEGVKPPSSPLSCQGEGGQGGGVINYPAIAQTAKRLNELRENWLNPPEWVDRIPEIVPGYHDRIIAKPGHEAALKQRTLTNLYNQRPAWLAHAHKILDQAVAFAYGWTDYTDTMPDEEILKRLLELNLAKA